jgi:hypothetical protein
MAAHFIGLKMNKLHLQPDRRIGDLMLGTISLAIPMVALRERMPPARVKTVGGGDGELLPLKCDGMHIDGDSLIDDFVQGIEEK